MSNLIYSHIVQLLATDYPKLKNMIRNHAYMKIVGIATAKHLTETLQMDEKDIDNALLQGYLERGIQYFESSHEDLRQCATLDHKRQRVQIYFQQTDGKVANL